MTTDAQVRIPDLVVTRIFERIRDLYDGMGCQLLFHGWPHVKFVHDKAWDFALERGGNCELVRVSALVHDLNYVVDRSSAVRVGEEIRREVLDRAGLDPATIKVVERVVVGASMAERTATVSLEVACLSDADTLYKALPTTPVLLSHRYMQETGSSLRDLADKILREQSAKLAEGYYFYDHALSVRYGGWARANLELWRAIREALDDPAISDLARIEEATLLDRRPSTPRAGR